MSSLFSTLPSDVWPHILRQLAPSDLTALSLTCKALHGLITSEDVFRHVYLTRSLTPPAKTSWSNLYRRSRAVLRIPTPVSNISLLRHTTYTHIVAVVGDHVFLTDKSKLFALRAGWAAQVSDLCMDEIKACIVPMPHGLGIVHKLRGQWQPARSERFAKFLTLCLETGKVVQSVSIPVGLHGIHVLDRDPFAMHPVRAVFVGGDDAKFLVYFVDNGQELLIVDRASGVCKRKVHMTGLLMKHGFRALVRSGGSCSSNQFVVTDIVEYVNDGIIGEKRVSITGLESGKVYIDLDDDSELLDVVRGGRDVLAWRAIYNNQGVVLWRMRIGDDKSKWPVPVGRTASSSLLHASTEFCIREDGNVMFLLPRGMSCRDGMHVDGRVMRIAFKNEDVECVESLKGLLEAEFERWNWAAVCAGGRLVVAGALSCGYFVGFDMVEGRQLWSVTCNAEVIDAALIGEHYLLAVGTSGRVEGWHFGAFCKQKGGEYSVGCCVPLIA